ncbi:hypothetical protein TNCV_3851181 [Trichonephila clavipes]|nr:hypothetical protein TNCV_3851181 [Trichonephila clavipes]
MLRLVPQTCIPILPKKGFLYCADLFKASLMALEYNKRALAALLNRRSFLGIWTVKQSFIPYHDKSSMRGMAKVVVHILLSGMRAIGRTLESGRRVSESSSVWKVVWDFWLD